MIMDIYGSWSCFGLQRTLGFGVLAVESSFLNEPLPLVHVDCSTGLYGSGIGCVGRWHRYRTYFPGARAVSSLAVPSGLRDYAWARR